MTSRAKINEHKIMLSPYLTFKIRKTIIAFTGCRFPSSIK